MVKASIDIGTNSTRLLIADVLQSGSITPIFMAERITRLGEGVNASRILREDAMLRVLDALDEYGALVREHHACAVMVFATSAARDANNRAEFVQRIQDRTGWFCKVLSGSFEADLSYRGAISDLDRPDHVVVCDVGGGSTEVIYGQGTHIQFTISLPLGSRRMTEKYFTAACPIAQSVHETRKFLTETLHGALEKQSIPLGSLTGICVGGTATTLAMMDAHLALNEAIKCHGYKLRLERLVQICRDLEEKTPSQRENMLGLHPLRADVILAGALIIECVYRYFNFKQTIISLRDLLFGILETEENERREATP